MISRPGRLVSGQHHRPLDPVRSRLRLVPMAGGPDLRDQCCDRRGMPALAEPEKIERPEGLQHRSLSGEFERIRAEGDAEDVARYEFIASTDAPVEFWRGYFEILDHGAKCVRMDWFKSKNAPVLWMHDRSDQRGVIEGAKLEGGKLKVTVRISSSEEKLIKDIDDGIIRNVSIGYRIHEEKIEKREVDQETGMVTTTTWRVTDWEPQEVSFVSIPADKSAGFRADDDESVKRRVRFLDEKAKAESPSTTTRMTTTTEPPALTQADIEKSRTDAAAAERVRAGAITAAAAAAKKNGMGDFSERAAEAIEKGEPLEVFQRHVIDNMQRTAPVTTAELGLSDKEQKRYSLLNVIDGLLGDGKGMEFEREVSDAARKANGHENGEREQGIIIPMDVLLRNYCPADPALAMRMGLSDRERTLISVSASSANASNLVALDLLPDMFIHSLREHQVLLNGATYLPGLVGSVDIPIELTNPTFYWVGEDTAPTEGVWTASVVSFRFKTIGANIPITRRSLKQTTPNIEGILAANLRRGCALGLEAKAFVGAVSSSQPAGIYSVSGIGDVASSGTLTFAHIQELRSDVRGANALGANSKFFTSPKGVRLLRSTGIVANDAQRIAEWGPDGKLRCEGRIVEESTLSPDTLDTDKTGILFGDPASIYVGMWGGMELTTDTATKAATGGKVLRIWQDADMQYPQPGHWSAIQDLA